MALRLEPSLNRLNPRVLCEQLESRLFLTAGGLDPSFGIGGKVITPLSDFSYHPIGEAALQPNGKILVVEYPEDENPRIVRYTTNGKLDSTFGVNGVLPLSFSPDAMAVRSDGKIVVASQTEGVLFARFTIDGKVDTTFGGADGEVTQSLFGGYKTENHVITKMLIRPDNSIILAGSVFDDSGLGVSNIAIAAYTDAGDIDSKFGATNSGATIGANLGYSDYISDAALAPDGKIVVVGTLDRSSYKYPNRSKDFAVAQFDDTGHPDPTFGGGDGWLTTDFTPSTPTNPKSPDTRDAATSLAIDSAGRIIVAGNSADAQGDGTALLAVARFLPDGALDLTFSPTGFLGGGKLRESFGLGYPDRKVGLGPGGTILLLSGEIRRLSADGAPDVTFGSAGTVSTDFGPINLLAQPDGKLIVVGASGQAFQIGSAVVARYLDTNQTPFNSKPFDLLLGNSIQLEDFDNGGEGIAFHDTDTANLGGAYRNTPVDIQAIPTGGNALAFAKSGEWTEYTVTASPNAYCNATLTYASLKGGGKFHLEIDGRAVTVPIALPSTGGWQNYKTISLPSFEVATGRHVLRLAMDANDSSGFVANFDVLNISEQIENMQIPFNANHTPWAPNQIIQAEDFNSGGEGFAYHDTDSANVGGAYRPGEGVDIEAAGDSGGGYDVGYTKAGEFLSYTIATPQAGLFGLDIRVASLRAGGLFHVEIDGKHVATFNVPATGGWQTYTTLSTPKNISLAAGQHSLKLVMDKSNSIAFVANFNWLKLKS